MLNHKGVQESLEMIAAYVVYFEEDGLRVGLLHETVLLLEKLEAVVADSNRNLAHICVNLGIGSFVVLRISVENGRFALSQVRTCELL